MLAEPTLLCMAAAGCSRCTVLTGDMLQHCLHMHAGLAFSFVLSSLECSLCQKFTCRSAYFLQTPALDRLSMPC